MKKTILTCAVSLGFLSVSQALDWPSSACLSKPVKIAPHLYSITAEKYDYGYANVYQTRVENAAVLLQAERVGGCSAIRRGNFVGRNFDWLYDDTDEFLVRVPAIPGVRHASIGIATGTRFVPGQPLPSADSAAEYEMLPFFTMDGINDAGVFCESNLMPVPDEPNDSGTRLDDPAARPISESSVTRFVLDYADSARHAVELLKKISIRNFPTAPIAWMIADAKETFVVEIIDNAIHVIEGAKAETLTNFYLSKSPVCGKSFSPHAMGTERHARLSEITRVESADAMLEVLRGESYTQIYRPGNEAAWWSEMNDGEYEDEKGETHIFSVYDDPSPDSWIFRRRMQEFASDRAAFARCREYEKRKGTRQASDLWHTVHSAAYDLTRRELRVRVQEEDKVYTFSL